MGGPIKEGVMHGIREPYRGGGVALVGNPVYPKTNGREHHAIIQPTSLETVQARNQGMIHPAMLRHLIPGKKYFKWLNRIPGFSKTINQAPKKIKGAWGILQPKLPKGGISGSTTGSAWLRGPANILSNIKKAGPLYKKAWDKAPYATLATHLWPAPYAAKYLIEGAKKIPWKELSPTKGFESLGETIFGKKEDDKNTDTDTGTGTGTTDNTNLPSVKKVLTDAELKIIEETKLKNAKADKDKRLTELLEIMNYDKSRKNAAYDALIDASEVIREKGFKDKSILPIVKATSARFDKPEQIKEAVGLMMAKGEIEKDIYKSKDTQSEQRIKSIMEGLGVDRETATAIDYKQPNNIAQALLIGISTRGRGTIPTADTTYSDLYSFLETRNRLGELKDIYDEDKIKDIGGIGKNKTFKTHADVVKDKPDGLYVVEEKVVEVKTGRNPKARVVGG
jgi:hypothetical protein